MPQIGDYTLIKQIGAGSMGMTYLAEHHLMKRPCIIKMLPEELGADAHFLNRFKNEVVALASLDHPHIARVHHVSHTGNHAFLVMESFADAEGKTCDLSQYLLRHKEGLTEEQIVQLARQIASALDYAHQKTMGAEPFAHGMLKLSNILVRPSQSELNVVLTDFGLSRIIGAGVVLSRAFKAVFDQLATHGGFVWNAKGDDRYVPGKAEGTAALHASFLNSFPFLAPEQKNLNPQKAPLMKADIYAFGVLIYYLLQGEMPDGLFELPKRQGNQKWNWDILLASCLQKDPSARPDLLLPLIEEMVACNMPLQPVLNPQAIERPTFEVDPGEIFQKELTVGHYQPEKKEDKQITPLLTLMHVIPSGTYYRGCQQGARDEMPRHAIQMRPFAIDVHPVTNEQFVLFLEAMGGEKDGQNHDIIRLRDSRIKKNGGRLNIESGYAKHPVVGVTWYGAVSYAKWVGKRLPTEAEWEIAAYGGDGDNLFPTGASIDRTQANFFSSDTTAVCSYPPNGLGLYDMAGNVYEWCQDWYDYHYYDLSVQEPDHPQGPHQGVYRVLRGGCWKSLKDDLRCAHRHRNNPGIMNGTYGFRCAADVCQ